MTPIVSEVRVFWNIDHSDRDSREYFVKIEGHLGNITSMIIYI